MIHVTYVKRTPLLADLLSYCQSAFTGSAPGRTSQLLRLRMLPADGIHSLAASGSATLPVLRLCSDLACITHTPILCKKEDFVKKQFRHFIHQLLLAKQTKTGNGYKNLFCEEDDAVLVPGCRNKEN